MLADLQEDAKAASIELAKMIDDLVALANRHFKLLAHYANEAWNHFKSDGLPSDQYAYASLGVGVAASTVEQHLKNINGVLLDINQLYAEQVAMASRRVVLTTVFLLLKGLNYLKNWTALLHGYQNAVYNYLFTSRYDVT